MTGEQIPLVFAAEASMQEADFVVASGNQEAFAWVTAWPAWPGYGLVLHGPPGCGKTHLAHIWAARSGAVFAATASDLVGAQAGILEAADRSAGDPLAEESLFHALNAIAARCGHLLLTATTAPVLWPVKLPDLRSRLLALPSATIAPPDDDMLAAVMMKLFADRQLRVGPEVVTYLVRRIERSCVAAQRIVAQLDTRALATGRALTLPFVRDALDAEP